MKKMVALLLCICIACPFGFAGAFAQTATAADAPVVLFEMDHETETTVGQDVPTKSNAVNMWSSRTDNQGNGVFIRIAEDAQQGKVAKIYSERGLGGGPRLTKRMYFDDTLTDMTVTYKFRTENDADAQFRLEFADKSNQLFFEKQSSGWSTAKIVFNFAAKTFTSYLNDVVVEQDNKIKYEGLSSLGLLFSVPMSGDNVGYFDDVVVTTTCPVDVNLCNDSSVPFRSVEEIMAPYAKYLPAPAVSMPVGKYELFNYDCSLNADNGVSTGTDALWTKNSGAAPAILNPQKAEDGSVINDGKLIRMTNASKLTGTASLYKKLPVGTKVKEVTVEYYALLSKSATYPELRDASGKTIVSAKNAIVSEKTSGAIVDDWNKIKAVFNIENSLLNVYVNDVLSAENIAFDHAMPAGSYELQMYIFGQLYSADTLLLDNFIMYQDAPPVMDTIKYYGTTGTTWSLVATDVVLDESSLVNNLRSHPRIMINDVAKIKAQIANDPVTKGWYAKLKASADDSLKKGPYAYKYGNGRNILDVARNIGTRLWTLAFAYLIEEDEQYVERGIAELRNAATFPDWSNGAPIIPSEIMLGFAGFYDWCYNSPTMTDEIKEELIQIVKDQALWQFVRSYDKEISVEIAQGSSNRTTVANSAAGLFALAVADELPQLSQYLLNNALVCMKAPTNAYAPDGAYPEGASYWSYPMRTITPFLSGLLSSVEEGYTLPEDAQWYFEHEALNNTLDYWAYVSGAVANFDFGDASPGLSATPAIFWHAQKNNDPFSGWYAKHILAKTNSEGGSAYFTIPWYDSEFDYYNDGQPLDKTFNASDSAQIASMRSSWTANDALYAAMQGGDNKTGHMFKSLGTFVIDANGTRFIRTIGRSDYSALYSPYMYYTERAEGQNTLVVNPSEATESFDQNSSAVARFVAHEEAENEAFTVLDMTETNNAFADAKRGMFMTKGRGSVVLQDEVKMTYPSEIWWFAHTDGDILISNDGKGAVLNVNDKRMYVKITAGPEDAKFVSMPARPLPTSPVAPDETYRNINKLAICMKNVTEATLAVEFVPLEAQEAVPSVLSEVKPISEWSVSDDTVSVARQAGYVVAMLAGSPNVLELEEKKLMDAKATIVPVIRDGVALVPAQYLTESVFATVTGNVNKLSVTRNYTTTEITEGLVTINDVVYAPAEKMAQALGMQLYTDASGLIVFSDRAVNYSAETKAAIVQELATRVYINGIDFEAFTTDKSTYYVPVTGRKPKVHVGENAVLVSGNKASFALGNKTYTIHFVEEEYVFAMRNVLLGVIPTANKQLGSSNPPESMTDGNLSSKCATISVDPTDVTYTLVLDGLYCLDSLILADTRPDDGSVMETATFEGLAADGTWIDLGSMADLEAGNRNGSLRTNTLAVAVAQPIRQIKMHVQSTDGYTARYFINELKAMGRTYISDDVPCYTETTYVKTADGLDFTTDFGGNVPKSGYLVVTLYKAGEMCALKIMPYAGEASLVTPMAPAEFDEVKIMLLDSFLNMRILATPEVL